MGVRRKRRSERATDRLVSGPLCVAAQEPESNAPRFKGGSEHELRRSLSEALSLCHVGFQFDAAPHVIRVYFYRGLWLSSASCARLIPGVILASECPAFAGRLNQPSRPPDNRGSQGPRWPPISTPSKPRRPIAIGYLTKLRSLEAACPIQLDGVNDTNSRGDIHPTGAIGRVPTDTASRAPGGIVRERPPPRLFRALIATRGFVLQHALARRESARRAAHHDGRSKTLRAFWKNQLRQRSMPTMCELDIFPEELLFDIADRRVSTDFVRFYEYFVLIQQTIPLPEQPLVFEIGSGYGGLARIIKLHHPGCALLLLDIEETLKGGGVFCAMPFLVRSSDHFTPANPMLPE